MDRLAILKALAHSEPLPIEKNANMEDVLAIGVATLTLHNVLHGRDANDDGADFEMNDLFGTLKALGLSPLVEKTESDSTDHEVPGEVYKSVPEMIVKHIDEDQRLITAIVLRPDVADLHDDIYDAAEVEKACHNFNTVCRKTNTQHTNPSEALVVESYVSPANFTLGSGEVLKGDWVMTMKVLDDAEWLACKGGDFTGFSIGCKAEVGAP